MSLFKGYVIVLCFHRIFLYITIINDFQAITEKLSAIRDGFILIGTTIYRIGNRACLENLQLEICINKKIKNKFKNIQRDLGEHRYGIYPILKRLNSIVAQLNETQVPSQLCSGDQLSKTVHELMTVSEQGPCSKRSEASRDSCHLSSFFTVVRRFLNRFTRVIDKF